LGRLFSRWLCQNSVCPEAEALQTVGGCADHNETAVLASWAYRDVLYMLIFFRLLLMNYWNIIGEEKEEVYNVFTVG
jgi:hypothetical protein